MWLINIWIPPRPFCLEPVIYYRRNREKKPGNNVIAQSIKIYAPWGKVYLDKRHHLVHQLKLDQVFERIQSQALANKYLKTNKSKKKVGKKLILIYITSSF